MIPDEQEEYATDVARVIEIAQTRVDWFDADDRTYSGLVSRGMFQEYLSLRKKWGYGSRHGQYLKSVSDAIWSHR